MKLGRLKACVSYTHPVLTRFQSHLRFLKAKKARFALKPDIWVIANSPIDVWKLHALGLVQYRWSECERALIVLFSSIAKWPGHGRELWIMLYDLGDIQICEKLVAMARLRNLPEEEIEAIVNITEAYDLCRQNRNQLAHFEPSAAGLEQREIRLLKRTKSIDGIPKGPITDALWDIRRVANEMRKLTETSTLLWAYFSQGQDKLVTTLPRKLPLPRKLWTPPQPNPKGRLPRPQSSHR